MSLSKQVVTVPLTDGLNDADDEFAGDVPGLIALNDARWGRDKQIGKRYGVQSIVEPLDGSPLSDAQREPNNVLDLDGVPHVTGASGTLRRNLKTNAWQAMNYQSPRPSRTVTDPLVRADACLVKSDCAVAGNIVCAVWERVDAFGTHTAWYGFWDVADDVPRPISGPTQFANTIINAVRVVAYGTTKFLITGINAATGARSIYYTTVDVASSFTVAAHTAIETVNSNDYGLCMNATRTGAYLCYQNAAGPTRILKQFGSAGTIIATKTCSAFGTQHVLHNNVLSKVVIIGPNGDIDHLADDLSGAVTAIAPFTNPASGAYTNRFYRATIGFCDSTGAMYAARSTSAPHAIVSNALDATQVLKLSTAFAASGERLIGGVVLSGHASLYISDIGTSLFAVANQGAIFTYDSDPTSAVFNQREAYTAAPVSLLVSISIVNGLCVFNPWARYGQDAIDFTGNTPNGTASFNVVGTSHLPHLDYYSAADTPVVVSAYPVVGFGTIGATGSFKRQIDLARIQVHNVLPHQNVNAQALRIIGSGLGTHAIDGVSHSDLSPPPVEWMLFDSYDAASAGNTLTSHRDDAGGTPATNRQWGFKLLWRYIDARGNVRRGPPSSILWSNGTMLVGPAGPHATEAAKLRIKPWETSSILGDKGYPEIEVYAAPYDSPDDFRLLGVVVPTWDLTAEEGAQYVAITNGGTQLAYSVELAVWDFQKPVPATLYTQSGELPTWPSPALLSLCSTESRLWGLNAEDRLDVWYTKPIALGYAPEWSDTLRVRVPQDGGPGVGIAALDDKVVVFKERKVFIIEGDPGDATGAGSSLRQPRLVSGDVGCVAVNSIVEGPFGVLFLSERGFVVLDRGLTFQDIGEKVNSQLLFDPDKGTSETVISSCIIPSENEVRFIVDRKRNGSTARWLIWNYRFNRWCTRSALAPTFTAAVDGYEWAVIDGTTSGNTVYRELLGSWSLTGTSGNQIKATMTTPWIKLNGLAGFGRVWRAVFTFRWYSNGIRIRTAQDYKPTTETFKTWTGADLTALADSNGRVQLTICPTVQKCEAIKFVVEEYVPSETYGPGRGFELVGGVTLEVGIKKGAYQRIAAEARK